MDHLFAPPQNLPPDMESRRVWIWLQLILLRLHVRMVKGADANFLYGLTRTGQVFLVEIGDTKAEHQAALARKKQQDMLNWTPSKAFTAALDGASLLSAHPIEGGAPEANAFLAPVAPAACAPIAGCTLPPPDT